MKDYKLRFTSESQAKQILNDFYDQDKNIWVTDTTRGTIYIAGTISVPVVEGGVISGYQNKDGFYISLRLRQEDKSLDQYITTDTDFKHSFGELPKIVPQAVPVWAVRAVLDIKGYGTQITSLLSNLPEPTKTIANRIFDYGNYFDRDSQMLNLFAAQLNLTKEQVDDIFIEAYNLKP